MIRLLVWFVAGLIFALGLGISGMTQPAKVVGFLNVFQWDSSLAFVMGGAIGVHFVAYRIRSQMSAPMLSERFALPARTDVSPRLLTGAALFGAGWGVAGFCPGPAIVSASTLGATPVIFVASMLGGMVLHRLVVPKEDVEKPSPAKAVG